MQAFEKTTSKLGFIGLGNMGSRIAKRLLDARYAVAVFDTDRSRSEALKEKGAKPTGSLAELASSVDVLLSCLTDDHAVRDVYYGPVGVLANAPTHVGKLSRAARGDYSPQFPLPLMNKDFRLILQLANDAHAALPAASASFQVNSEAMATMPTRIFRWS